MIKKKSDKEEIMRVSLEIFNEKGYAATSIDDICKALAINRPVLYYHFKSKRDLFFSIHKAHIERNLLPYMETASKIKDPLKRLSFMVEEFARMISHHPELRLLIHETMSLKDDYFAEVRLTWRNHYILLKQTISELVESKIIKKRIKPSWASLFVLGMITWMTFWLDFDKKENQEDLFEAVKDFVLTGLLGRNP
ncbi:MAG TPA: TetR/AcrR family transcriptional regulator [Syntrophorhabdaceae bacterium]|nr:TetR/AcrR family transcriptional regulator [Syntrophorhabdaceae bacterium]HPP06169.1 TetR/AcrR family transcriptional regulator [Syntrophorhabdaceae bacterium]